MSFDLALSKGTLSIGSDGDLAKVRDNTKLVQDVLKVFFTPTGSDPFFPQKGSNITTQNIGQLVNPQFVLDRSTASAASTLKFIQNLQQRQSSTQTLSPGEMITSLGDVEVNINQEDPRQFDIRISVITGALVEVILPAFTLSTY